MARKRAIEQLAGATAFVLCVGFIGFWVLSCSQTEGGGSGGLSPSTKPYLLEGLLCSDISDTQQPVGIADTYAAGNRVYFWLHWANVQGKHTIDVYWYNPAGSEMHHESYTLSTDEDRFITWFYLNTTSSAQLGEWLVAAFLDEQFMRSYVFNLM